MLFELREVSFSRGGQPVLHEINASIPPGTTSVVGPSGAFVVGIAVQAFDGDVALSPQTMDKIVRAVLQAVNDEQAHRQRVRAEQRITTGVSHELEERD